MQNLSPFLQQALIFSIYTSTIVFVVVSVFLVKLIVELTALSKTSQAAVELFHKEVKPTMEELQSALKSVNTIASTADEKVEALKNNVSSIITPLQSNFSKVKLSILKGIAQGMNLFLKK